MCTHSLSLSLFLPTLCIISLKQSSPLPRWQIAQPILQYNIEQSISPVCCSTLYDNNRTYIYPLSVTPIFPSFFRIPIINHIFIISYYILYRHAVFLTAVHDCKLWHFVQDKNVIWICTWGKERIGSATRKAITRQWYIKYIKFCTRVSWNE